MKYKFQEITIAQLVDFIDNERLDLNPDYQRNFIWSKQDQSDLVDTLLKEYPLPNFFMYDNEGKLEMVDGQQRSKSIYRFVKGHIVSSKDMGSLAFKDCDQEKILNYKLPFVIIDELRKSDSLKDFYVLINKKGKHLNIPEVQKSEYFDKNFMKLSNEMLEYQNFIELNLFTEAASKRMNDREYVQELLVYLHLGIRDKKIDVEKVFEKDIDFDEYDVLKNSFKSVIDLLKEFNNIQELKRTRYKQKNDFYTLFTFVNQNIEQDISILKYQYKILLILGRKDEDGNQFIRPTNEDCEPLREYARNCVTQSNSKSARESRLSFLNSILKNKDHNSNETLREVLKYLGSIYGNDKISLVNKGEYELLDIKPIY